jgi:type II secretory pathway pseudopilin PulG
MSVPKFIIKSLLKPLRGQKKASGFTLLELLIGLALTFVIITPIMTLAISFMNNDRQEQAKNASQQDIQAALDYIAQDLQQAVYVYDAAALSKAHDDDDPAKSGIKNQIPPVSGAVNCQDEANCTPVLAFWKRKYLDRNDTVKDPVTGASVPIQDIKDSNEKSDRFVYSLVVYYLIKPTPSDTTWSKVNRIGRFEVNGGIINAANTNTTSTTYNLNPDKGFAPFDLGASPGKIKQSMNSWEKGTGSYDQQVYTLVDYIDNTPIQDFEAADVSPTIKPPENDGADAEGNPASEECGKRTGQTKDADGDLIRASSRVPPGDTEDTGSFYACVNPVNDQGQSVVQVFLRGNALARLSKDATSWQINADNKQKQMINRPLASVRVAVRGLLNEQTE